MAEPPAPPPARGCVRLVAIGGFYSDVPRAAAQRGSRLIASMLEDVDEGDTEPLVLPELDATQLRVVAAYINALPSTPGALDDALLVVQSARPVETNDVERAVPLPWLVRELTQLGGAEALRVVEAGDYVDAPVLMEAAANAVAARTWRRTEAEARAALGAPPPPRGQPRPAAEAASAYEPAKRVRPES